jgi:hypothetical protein
VRVKHRRLDGAAEDRLGMVREIRVERVVAGHEHHERRRSGSPGPAGLLPQRGQRPGKAREHDRIQAADVQPQLQRVRRGHAQQLARGECGL